MDASGSWALAPSFGRLGSPWGGLCFADESPGGTSYGIMDTSGAWLSERRLGMIAAGARPSDAAFAARPGSGWGIALPDGTWATDERAFGDPSLFEAPVGPFDSSSGLAAARDAGSGLWGLVDASGSWALAPAFKDLGRPGDDGLVPARSAG